MKGKPASDDRPYPLVWEYEQYRKQEKSQNVLESYHLSGRVVSLGKKDIAEPVEKNERFAIKGSMIVRLT